MKNYPKDRKATNEAWWQSKTTQYQFVYYTKSSASARRATIVKLDGAAIPHANTPLHDKVTGWAFSHPSGRRIIEKVYGEIFTEREAARS